MDFSLNSDQKILRDTVRQFMETEMRPVLRAYEREEKLPAAELRKLGELGCCGMLIPEEWGGAGMDTVSYVVMLEEVARVILLNFLSLDIAPAMMKSLSLTYALIFESAVGYFSCAAHWHS